MREGRKKGDLRHLTYDRGMAQRGRKGAKGEGKGRKKGRKLENTLPIPPLDKGC